MILERKKVKKMTQKSYWFGTCLGLVLPLLAEQRAVTANDRDGEGGGEGAAATQLSPVQPTEAKLEEFFGQEGFFRAPFGDFESPPRGLRSWAAEPLELPPPMLIDETHLSDNAMDPFTEATTPVNEEAAGNPVPTAGAFSPTRARSFRPSDGSPLALRQSRPSERLRGVTQMRVRRNLQEALQAERDDGVIRPELGWVDHLDRAGNEKQEQEDQAHARQALAYLMKTAEAQLQVRLAKQFSFLVEDHQARVHVIRPAEDHLDLLRCYPELESQKKVGCYQLNVSQLAARLFPDLATAEWVSQSTFKLVAQRLVAVADRPIRKYLKKYLKVLRKIRVGGPSEGWMSSSTLQGRLQIARNKIARIAGIYRNDTERLRAFARSLDANRDRCIDGLLKSLTEAEIELEEQAHAVLAPIADPQLKPYLAREGVLFFIHSVIQDAKLAFVARHGRLGDDWIAGGWRQNAEFQTTVEQVLLQSMLYPLGLPGEESGVEYPVLGSFRDRSLQPEGVFLRFFLGQQNVTLHSGGQRREVDFAPFDLVHFLAALQQTRRNYLEVKPGRQLSDRVLTDWCAADPLLRDEFLEFSENLGRAEAERHTSSYFESAAGHASRPLLPTQIALKDQFWIYLLEKYGFIFKS